MAEIVRTYKVSEVHEVSVEWNGCDYLVIYGRHVNGWFVAVPNWEVSTEAGEPGSVSYNAERLSKVFGEESVGQALAKAVKRHWEGLRNA